MATTGLTMAFPPVFVHTLVSFRSSVNNAM